MPFYTHRKDGNHDEMVDAYKAKGYLTKSTTMVGEGFPDLVVWHPSFPPGFVRLVEVKHGNGKHRTKQDNFKEKGWPVDTVRTEGDIA